MPIRNISIDEPGQRAHINYNDGFGDWIAIIHIQEGNHEQLIRLLTPQYATNPLNSVVVTSVAQLLLGQILTLGEPAQFIEAKNPEYCVCSFPILQRET